MKLQMFQIDNFTQEFLSGNLAAVCPLEEWLPDAKMQALALENNLSETAFFVKKSEGRYDLRWFTPTVEADICGHATLASAFTLWNYLGDTSTTLGFETRSGLVEVTKNDGMIVLHCPTIGLTPCQQPPEALSEGLGLTPVYTLTAGPEGQIWSYLAVYDSEQHIRELEPNFRTLMSMGEGVGQRHGAGH